MLVNLARKLFAPNGALYSHKDNPHTFLDDWEEKLPKGSQIVDEKGKVIREIEWTEEEKKKLKEDRGKVVVSEPKKLPEGSQPSAEEKKKAEEDEKKAAADLAKVEAENNAELKLKNTGSSPEEKLTPEEKKVADEKKEEVKK